MARRLKHFLYFPVAHYFSFFAALRLRRWSPRVVVVTGSNGKTTALNLLEVQLGTRARYSHRANSSFGIPFDILGFKRENYSLVEWPIMALLAPFRIFIRPYKEKIYVVEADCDRPIEGNFLSALLRPDIVVWLSSARTHSMNFDGAVQGGAFSSVDDAIAHEFGFFAERAKELLVINADNERVVRQSRRSKAKVVEIRRSELSNYAVNIGGTSFTISGKEYHAPILLPEATFYAIAASVRVAEHLGVTPTTEMWKLEMPPGRSSILKGIKNTVIIDSTYNANAESVEAVLHMIAKFPSKETWLILGDLTEQGNEEKAEHQRVARAAAAGNFTKVILVGPRLKQYALPFLPSAMSFDQPLETLTYIQSTVHGGETLVFKGARFLEGVVEHLLANKADVSKLCRREPVWQKRRAAWGL